MKIENVNQSQTQFGEMFERLSLMSGEQGTAALQREAQSIGADISQLRFEMNNPNQPLPNGKLTVISDMFAILEFTKANNIDPQSLFYDLNQDGRVYSIISTFNSIVSAQGLQGLPYLSKLGLQGAGALECGDLSGLPQLKILSLMDFKPSTFRFLTDLKNLQEFHALRAGLSDLNVVTGLHSLETLSFGENGITDVSPLVKLTNLKALSMESENIEDLSPLAQLPELATVKMNSLLPQDISFLLRLPKLQNVSISKFMVMHDPERECLEALGRAGVVVKLS